MKKDKKLLLYFLISLYLSIGIYLSITTGITSDESFEQLNWDENVSGIKSLLNYGHYDEFLRYLDKYHGVAFHYISQPIQFFSSGSYFPKSNHSIPSFFRIFFLRKVESLYFSQLVVAFLVVNSPVTR